MHKLHRIESWKKIFYLTAKNILLLDNNEQKWQCLLKSSQTYPTSLHRKEMGRNTHVQVCTLPKIVDKVQKKKKKKYSVEDNWHKHLGCHIANLHMQ